MADRCEYLLSRNGEGLIVGTAMEVAAALGLSVDSVYRRSTDAKPDRRGYRVERVTPRKPAKPLPIAMDCPPDDPGRRWSPLTSGTLAALRRRRAEYEGYEPRWEP